MTAQWRSATRGRPPSESIDAAWRDLEAAGEARSTGESDHLAADLDRRKREEAVEAQLAYLKKKMGRDK
jgi:hypothetical protein